MAGNLFARGANTMNSMLLKSIGRKGYHKNSAETVRETMKSEGDDMATKAHNLGDPSSHVGKMWVPHDRTGIYYPIGHEKVMEDVPRPSPQTDTAPATWISYGDDLS